MAASRCSCEAPATRLVRVAARSAAGQEILDGQRARSIAAAVSRTEAPDKRATMWACCEAHRHAVKQVLEESWAEEIAAGDVKVLLGQRRRAGL